MSERRAGQVTGQARATQRSVPRPSPDAPALIARIVALATRFGRYGSRRITALLRQEGWRVNHKRSSGSGVRKACGSPGSTPNGAASGSRPARWCGGGPSGRPTSSPTTSSSTAPPMGARCGSSPSWMRTTRECLRLDVARRLRRDDVLARLAQLFVERGPPTLLRSDNGPEFTATAVRDWLHRVGVTTLFIAPGSPWENGDVESCNGKLRDECLNRERFDTLLEAQILIEGWRREYNQIRPHRALGYRPPRPGNAATPGTSHDARPGDRTNLTTGTTIGGRSIDDDGYPTLVRHQHPYHKSPNHTQLLLSPVTKTVEWNSDAIQESGHDAKVIVDFRLKRWSENYPAEIIHTPNQWSEIGQSHSLAFRGKCFVEKPCRPCPLLCLDEPAPSPFRLRCGMIGLLR